jgi:hypothetical protein
MQIIVQALSHENVAKLAQVICLKLRQKVYKPLGDHKSSASRIQQLYSQPETRHLTMIPVQFFPQVSSCRQSISEYVFMFSNGHHSTMQSHAG